METAHALRRVACGDRAAFAALYSSARAPLVRYASALLAGDADAAMDVVDEAFLDIWRQAGRYSGEGSADGWIRRIVRNKAVDWLRSRSGRTISLDADDGVADAIADDADPADLQLEKASEADVLRRAMERLSPDHREAVWLCYFEERSLAEIAEIAGCPENTVKTRLFHARRLLRHELELMGLRCAGPRRAAVDPG